MVDERVDLVKTFVRGANDAYAAEVLIDMDSKSVSSDPIVWNVPNKLSAARIVLAVACFLAIAFGWYVLSLMLFLLAALTDWLDGYWARRFGQITQLGRILDPFADKVIICGAFIMLSAIDGSRITPWMAVLVTARELLVTALRGLCEGRSIDFSAKWAGKVKMVLQCLAVTLSLWGLSSFGADASPAFKSLLVGSVWLSLAATLYSGWGYIRLALEMMADDTDGAEDGR
ncbi:MAG: CDP-diacylglycerol--glycerol-3-phosphate 3-phosphatidyltransferase [Aeoliella sp.]